jgi:hypothetical protein
LFIEREKQDVVTLLSACSINQEVARNSPDKRRWIYQARHLLTARRSHENLLDEIRRGIPTDTPTQILQKASTLGFERSLQTIGRNRCYRFKRADCVMRTVVTAGRNGPGRPRK